MSDLRVALVAEGPTDTIVIEAALKALLPRPFVLTQLQPEATKPKLGNGWGGVVRWCLDFATRGHARLEDDPTLPGFDLFVVHIDADVADQDYADVSDEIATLAIQRGWPRVPIVMHCPPASGSVEAMRMCLLAWSGLREPGPRTVFCVPSKAVEAWLTAAILDGDHALQNGLECNHNLGAQLRALPVAQRINKTPREYRARARAITDSWTIVRHRCTQAERFSQEVGAVFV